MTITNLDATDEVDKTDNKNDSIMANLSKTGYDLLNRRRFKQTTSGDRTTQI